MRTRSARSGALSVRAPRISLRTLRRGLAAQGREHRQPQLSEAARAQKLYGSLLLTVGIRADGSVETVVVDRPSGRRSSTSPRSGSSRWEAPYAPFPPDISRDTDILYITRTWSFSPGDSPDVAVMTDGEDARHAATQPS